MKARTLAVAIAALVAAPAAAQQQPEVPDATITDGTAQQNLDAARALWKAKGTRTYRMRVQHTCFCPEQYTRPRTVIVRGGKLVQAAKEVRDFATVGRLFAIVQHAIDAKVVVLGVSYDAKRGFPRSISVNRSFQIVDEESGYGASRFKAL